MRPLCTHSLARRSLALALAGTLSASIWLLPSTARAATSEQIQQQLVAAQQDLSDLQLAYDQAESLLSKTTYDLDQTRSSIGALEDEIDVNEAKLGEARQNLAAIIESTYKQGGEPKLLELILSAESFEDLTSRIHYANRVSQAKQDAIQTVCELQDSLERDKASLQEQEQEQEALLATQQEQAAAAEQAAADQEAYVEGLSDELAAALEAERIAAAEASRKAAEEAARKEAEERAAREKAEAEERAAREKAEAEERAAREKAEADKTPSDNAQDEKTPDATDDAGGQDSETDQAETNNQDDADQSDETTTPSSASTASSSFRQAAVNAALSQVGKAYGHANNGSQWDCSGLTSWAYGQAGVSLTACSGTYSYGQFQITKGSGNWTSDASALQPGDLVFYSFDGGRTCYHVAMYIGGGSVVHAIDYGKGVAVTSLYMCSGFCGGGCPV